MQRGWKLAALVGWAVVGLLALLQMPRLAFSTTKIKGAETLTIMVDTPKVEILKFEFRDGPVTHYCFTYNAKEFSCTTLQPPGY